MSNFDIIKSRDESYVAHTYGRFPAAIVRGHNATCYDADGKKYIDFTSGIGVNSLGFCDKGWTDAVTKQLGLLQHISNLYYTEPCGKLAELLCSRTGMKKVFFIPVRLLPRPHRHHPLRHRAGRFSQLLLPVHRRLRLHHPRRHRRA